MHCHKTYDRRSKILIGKRLWHSLVPVSDDLRLNVVPSYAAYSKCIDVSRLWHRKRVLVLCIFQMFSLGCDLSNCNDVFIPTMQNFVIAKNITIFKTSEEKNNAACVSYLKEILGTSYEYKMDQGIAGLNDQRPDVQILQNSQILLANTHLEIEKVS